MTESTIQPYAASIVVETSKPRAFRVFTEGMDAWWPRNHSIAAKPQQRAVMECREGGRWYEIADDGSECQWGKVLTWSPPDRLVLAWQITSEWKFDPDFLTEVSVEFLEEGSNRLESNSSTET